MFPKHTIETSLYGDVEEEAKPCLMHCLQGGKDLMLTCHIFVDSDHAGDK